MYAWCEALKLTDVLQFRQQNQTEKVHKLHQSWFFMFENVEDFQLHETDENPLWPLHLKMNFSKQNIVGKNNIFTVIIIWYMFSVGLQTAFTVTIETQIL